MQMTRRRPQPCGLVAVAGRLLCCSSSPMSPHRLLLAPRIRPASAISVRGQTCAEVP